LWTSRIMPILHDMSYMPPLSEMNLFRDKLRDVWGGILLSSHVDEQILAMRSLRRISTSHQLRMMVFRLEDVARTEALVYWREGRKTDTGDKAFRAISEAATTLAFAESPEGLDHIKTFIQGLDLAGWVDYLSDLLKTKQEAQSSMSLEV